MELAKGPNQGLEVWNRLESRSQPRRPNTQEVDIGR